MFGFCHFCTNWCNHLFIHFFFICLGSRSVWTIPLLNQSKPLACEKIRKTTPEKARDDLLTTRPPMHIPSYKFLSQCMDPNDISIKIDFNQQDFGIVDWAEINCVIDQSRQSKKIRIEINSIQNLV